MTRILQREYRWVHTNKDVLDRFQSLYEGLIAHDGFGEMRLEFRILKRGQKEVVIHCGKQYRYVVDYRPNNPLAWEVRRESAASGEAPRPTTERRRRQEAIAFPDRRQR